MFHISCIELLDSTHHQGLRLSILESLIWVFNKLKHNNDTSIAEKTYQTGYAQIYLV